MTTPFNAYAAYYDLLYRDKDYAGEADYIDRLIRRHQPQAGTLLELGSGTGKHARLLVERGYEVHGVERSADMIEVAQRGAEDGRPAPVFIQGDLRTARLDDSFDAVISLFHVFSYLPTSADVLAGLQTARTHLNAGGIFIFDFWYGPAVLTERPAVRVKRMADATTEVVRLAEPDLRVNENLVDVRYHVTVRDRRSGAMQEIDETHRMRYFFLPEIDEFARQAGFERVAAEEWLTGRAPGAHSWGVCVVLREIA